MRQRTVRAASSTCTRVLWRASEAASRLLRTDARATKTSEAAQLRAEGESVRDAFHVRYTLLYRVWVIFAGAVAVIGVPFWFNAVEQGYFYTFSSLVAAQVLFELGTGFVITQLTAHEKSCPGFDDNSPAPGNLDRIALILRFSDRWFRRAAMLYLLIVGSLGAAFFVLTGVLPLRQWIGPWLALTLASAGSLRLVPKLALLEGMGEIGEVARLRLAQSAVGNLLMWSLLFSGAGLWALSVVPATASLFGHVWFDRHALVQDLRLRLEKGVAAVFDWRTEVLPLQWRIALSWASGYLIFQAITPIAFAKLGTVAAGQIGLALAIFSGVQSVGMSWMYTKMPRYAELVARNERKTLNTLFATSLRWTVSLIALGVLAVVLGAALLERVEPRFAIRLPTSGAMACLGAASLANGVIFSLALYMRSHKEEPMLVSSVACGFITLFAVYFAAPHGLLPTTLAYTLVTVCIGLPWAWLLFRPYYLRPTRDD